MLPLANLKLAIKAMRKASMHQASIFKDPQVKCILLSSCREKVFCFAVKKDAMNSRSPTCGVDGGLGTMP